MECTQCHEKNELIKGRKICKDCKNKYERERRKNSKIIEDKKKKREIDI